MVEGRLISLTDPEARHGRKSRSRLFNGYKLSVLGDVVSGLIAAVTVAPGNTHDGSVAPRIIRRAKRLREDIELVLADTAYGGARLRFVAEYALGVKLLAPPPAASRARKSVSKAHFGVDFEAGMVTCPAGQATSDFDMRPAIGHDVLVRAYRWPKEVCGGCALRQSCLGKSKGGKRLRLHPYEQQLREATAGWKDPEVRCQYRVRTQCERLVDRMTRHGARHADAWGLGAANFQAHCIGMACNLELLARKLATREGVPRQPDPAVSSTAAAASCYTACGTAQSRSARPMTRFACSQGSSPKVASISAWLAASPASPRALPKALRFSPAVRRFAPSTIGEGMAPAEAPARSSWSAKLR